MVDELQDLLLTLPSCTLLNSRGVLLADGFFVEDKGGAKALSFTEGTGTYLNLEILSASAAAAAA